MNPPKLSLRSDDAPKNPKVEGSSRESKASVSPSETSTETKGKFTSCASSSSDVSKGKPSSSSTTEFLPHDETKDPSLTPPMSPLKFPHSNAIKEQMLLLPRKIYLAEQFPPNENDFYIDKTPLINFLTERRKLYISGPRRFGKSMALRMINQFISKTSRFDWNQEILSIDNSETSGTKKQYLIMDKKKYKLAHDSLYKQFYVLLFDFSDLRMRSFDGFFESYLETLKDNFDDWKALIVNDSYRREFEDLLNSMSNMNEKNCDAIKKAVCILRADIRKTNDDANGNNQTLRVAVLVDEFDSAFLRAKIHGFQSIFEDFIEDQFSSFKNSDVFQLFYFTGVCGISSISKSNMNSIFLNILTQLTVFSTEVTDFFGFSESEIDSILKWAYKEKSYAEVKALLKEHYGGYYNEENESIYNPSSISQALSCKKINIYWSCSDTRISSIDELFFQPRNSRIETDLGKLIGSVDPVTSIVNANELSDVTKMPTITNTDIGLVLFELGLVTRYDNVFFIPNLEVRELILEYIKKHIFKNGKNFQDTLVPHLFNKNIRQFFLSLKDFFGSLPINFNTEYRYQLIMYTLLNMYRGEPKDIGMEGSGGSGRYDLRIDFPGKKVGYIFELKLVSFKKNLSLVDFVHSAKEGLDQIKDTGSWDCYLGKVYKDDIDIFFIAGIAFYRKSFFVLYEKRKMINGKVDDEPVETGHFNHTKFN